MLLIVDNDRQFLRQAGQALATIGDTLLAADASEAYAHLAEHQARLTVILIEVRVRGVDGAPFIGHLRNAAPLMPIIAVHSGRNHEVVDGEFVGGAVDVLSKPITPRWRTAIRRACVTGA